MYVCLNRGTAGGKLPFDQFVQLACDAGFQGADVDLDWAQKNGVGALRDLFASKKLRFGGWGLPEWSGDAQKLSDSLPGFKAQAQIAHELRMDSCCTWIMPSSELPFMQNWNFHVQRLKPLAQILADEGLRMGLEFIGPFHLRRMYKHAFVFTAEQMLELADAVGENAGLLVDSFHCHAAGADWEDLAKIPSNRIVLAHLNDAPNLPVAQLQDFKRLLPGEGVIDLSAFLNALQKTGYNGPVSVETFEAVANLPPEEGARKAWAATQKVLSASGIA